MTCAKNSPLPIPGLLPYNSTVIPSAFVLGGASIFSAHNDIPGAVSTVGACSKIEKSTPAQESEEDEEIYYRKYDDTHTHIHLTSGARPCLVQTPSSTEFQQAQDRQRLGALAPCLGRRQRHFLRQQTDFHALLPRGYVFLSCAENMCPQRAHDIIHKEFAWHTRSITMRPITYSAYSLGSGERQKGECNVDTRARERTASTCGYSSSRCTDAALHI